MISMAKRKKKFRVSCVITIDSSRLSNEDCAKAINLAYKSAVKNMKEKLEDVID